MLKKPYIGPFFVYTMQEYLTRVKLRCMIVVGTIDIRTDSPLEEVLPRREAVSLVPSGPTFSPEVGPLFIDQIL